VALEPGDQHELVLGTLQLKLRRTARELWLRVGRSPGQEWDDDPWVRWAVQATARIELLPATPDRPLVVSTEHPYHLPPHAESHIFVRIPLFVRVVVVDGGAEIAVADVPASVLSDTWWGTFTEGELAYWLTTKARTELTDDLFLPHYGMCPLRLMNESEEALPIERFAVRVPHLSLFAEGGRTWTDRVTVRYEDSPEGSEIDFAGSAPPEAGAAKLVSAPRSPLERGFHAKTFDKLRTLSNLGS
jgi:hypothetical protein